jgi:hypothetical protein
VLLGAVYGEKLAKLQGTRKAHVQYFHPAEHTRRPAEEFWHDHNFLRAPCDFRFAVSPQGTCTKKERYPCACRKFKMSGERRNVASKQLRDTYLCLTFHLCSPCQCQVSTTYVTRACEVRVPRGLQEGLTGQERALLHMVQYLSFEGQL